MRQATSTSVPVDSYSTVQNIYKSKSSWVPIAPLQVRGQNMWDIQQASPESRFGGSIVKSIAIEGGSREREKLHYVHSASLAYEDGSVFMSGPFAEWL